jgi:transposase
VACLITSGPEGEPRQERQTLSSRTPDLVRLREWLTAHHSQQVAMESTGVHWRPILNVLEGHLEALVVTAQHITAVPGRKTDVNAAEWIADLLQHGLLRPSFIPPAGPRVGRELTRSRTSLVAERSRVLARLHKGLEDAHSKLGHVATDLKGQSAQLRLHALVEGDLTPETMADLARGSLRSKQAHLVQALSGYLQAHQRFLLAEHLQHLSDLQAAITRISALDC